VRVAVLELPGATLIVEGDTVTEGAEVDAGLTELARLMIPFVLILVTVTVTVEPEPFERMIGTGSTLTEKSLVTIMLTRA